MEFIGTRRLYLFFERPIPMTPVSMSPPLELDLLGPPEARVNRHGEQRPQVRRDDVAERLFLVRGPLSRRGRQVDDPPARLFQLGNALHRVDGHESEADSAPEHPRQHVPVPIDARGRERLFSRNGSRPSAEAPQRALSSISPSSILSYDRIAPLGHTVTEDLCLMPMSHDINDGAHTNPRDWDRCPSSSDRITYGGFTPRFRERSTGGQIVVFRRW